ncbi:Ig-like domain-containing protein [Paenibacillus sp. IB182496]|uniref:Ig-like domain-containing protein n=1 Tax=Paenibacillus sabuli TaxID=2772509 RepID=A0A927BQV1_9BACL|nr:Ig-like domain-containing protein [Paenibacillus sabuli]MBD2844085.1 Ig-like domain-containing protein [Paenibacillus sabuli]
MMSKHGYRRLAAATALSLLLSVIVPLQGRMAGAETLGEGELVHEAYDSIATGDLPSGSAWRFGSADGTIGVAELPDASDKSLKIDRTATSASSGLYARYTHPSALTGQYVVRTRAMAAQTDATVLALELRDDSRAQLAAIVMSSDGNIRYQLPSGSVAMQPYEADVWYEIVAAVDTEAQQYSIWIDGVRRAGPLAFKNAAADDLTNVEYQMYRTTIGTAYFDDLDIYAQQVALDETTLSVPLGQSEQLSATVAPSAPFMNTLTWTSSDPAVARVDAAGEVTAWGYGSAVIRATSAGGAYAEATVTVPPGPDVPVEALTIASASPELDLLTGESVEVEAELTPFYATNKQVRWTSSAPTVVSVVYDVDAGTATLSALQAGAAVVTAVSDDGDYADTLAVQVTAGGDLLSERFESAAPGAQPGALSYPTAAGVTAEVAEHPYHTSKALLIEQSGPTASTAYVSRTVPGSPAKMKIAFEAMALQTEEVVFAAVVRDSAGAALAQAAFLKNGKIGVIQDGAWQEVMPYESNRMYRFELALDTTQDRWELYVDGNPVRLDLDMAAGTDAIARVQFGLYRLSTGAALFDDLQHYSYQAVTGLDLSAIPQTLALHRTLTLEPAFTPVDPTFRAVAWTSSDPAVIEVDPLGRATALGDGTAVLSAVTADGALTDSVTIEVEARDVTGVTLDRTSLTLPAGSDRALTAAVLPADASDPAVAWSSSDSAVAEVDDEGRVYAREPGTAQITALTDDGGFTAVADVTVVARNVQATYYVSPDGDDANPGTLAEPLRTLQQARDTVRTINGDMTGDIVVYLRGGLHRQTETLAFDERDSGTNDYWIRYLAYSEEEPVIDGGRTITDWTVHDAARGIYKASAGADIETRQLYVNGIRGVRARSADDPLTDPVKTESGYITDDPELAGWGNVGDLEFVYHTEWVNPRSGVDTIVADDGQAVITMRQPGWDYVTVRSGIEVPWYIENAYELLDEPGEWYLDRSTDTFYYMPRPGENMATAEVIAPVVEDLVTIRGTTLATPADGIHFEGLTFAYTTWLRPSSDLGHADAQNNLLRYGVDKLPAGAITVEKARHIRFERNTFAKLGIAGIKMVNGVQESQIIGNRFYDLSGSAINVGETTKHDDEIANPSDPRKLLKHMTITNNYIHDIGVDYRSSAAIGLGFVSGAEVSHNEIFNVPYTGITAGYGLGYVKSSALRDVRIHGNFIHDLLGDVIYDGGAIYTVGGTGGTAANPNTITENYIRNQMNRYGVIYNDEGSTFWTSARNVIDQRETPVWDEIFPVSWIFVNGALTSHDLHYDRNYTTAPGKKIVGTNVSESDTRLHPDGDWPAEAQAIIASAGLEPAYQDIAGQTPERIVLPAQLELNTGDSAVLEAGAVTGKDEPVSLVGASIWYTSDDTSVAQVSAAGSVYAAGAGAARIRVHVRTDEMLWQREVPVYVDDAFDRLSVYFVENKAKHELADPYTMVMEEQRELKVEAHSLYGQRLPVTSVVYASGDTDVFTVDAQGLMAATGGGSAELTVSAVVGGQSRATTITVEVIQYGDPAGLAYPAYPLDDAIADDTGWYIAGSGTLQAQSGSLAVTTPSGFATYQEETYEDELLTMDLRIDASGGWPSLVLRSRQPDESFSTATNDLYLICLKADVIELHRFNGGERTVIYGNLAGYTSQGGPAIPNDVLPFGERHRVQVGAVNESGGVRLILNIDGENVFYSLDEEAERIDDPGYFGLYARSGTMTLYEPEPS